MLATHGTPPAPRPRRRGQRGLFMFDQVLAMAIMMVLLAALAFSIHHQRGAERTFADRRAVARAAEHALLALQAGEPLEQLRESAESRFGAPVEFAPLETPAGPAEGRWVAATAQLRNTTCRIVGLVPGGAK